jgi:HEAT repeat protein
VNEPRRLSAADREEAFRDIRDRDLSRVVRAAKLLADDRASTTTSRLVLLLETETRMEVRQGVLYALAWHANLETWDMMIRVLSDAREHPHVRGQAAEGLAYSFHQLAPGSVKFEVGVAALTAALKDPSPEVRYCAVHALGATRHRPLMPLIERMLDDKTLVPGWIGTVGDEAARALEWMTS